MTGPTWSMKVGRRSEARSAGACTGLSSDLRPVPRRREGEREKKERRKAAFQRGVESGPG